MSEEGVLGVAKDAADVIKDTISELGSGINPEDVNKPFEMPSRDELLAMLDSMGLADEEKEQLRAALMDDGLGLPVAQPWTSQALILMTFLLLVASIFGLIGYRLYKSIKDKETKKEEKRQVKLQKKRK